jgi:hypothetical protein
MGAAAASHRERHGQGDYPDVPLAGGRQLPEMVLAALMRPFAVTWPEQRKTLIGCLPCSLARLDAIRDLDIQVFRSSG